VGKFILNLKTQFLNNPDDPDFSFLKETIRNKLIVQIRRLAATFLMFVIIILAVIRTPFKLSKYVILFIFVDS
jgi:E3 ubiquitin-protein ligase DOA10